MVIPSLRLTAKPAIVEKTVIGLELEIVTVEVIVQTCR